MGKGNDVLSQLRCKAQIEGWFEGFETMFGKYIGSYDYACSSHLGTIRTVQAILYGGYKPFVVTLQTTCSHTTKRL